MTFDKSKQITNDPLHIKTIMHKLPRLNMHQNWLHRFQVLIGAL
jgi:hypothetical protein